jgi:purine-binding chemotaxis protein CheW
MAPASVSNAPRVAVATRPGPAGPSPHGTPSAAPAFSTGFQIRLEQTDAQIEPGRDLQYVTFHLGGPRYGIEIRRVREIVRVESITPIPQAPAHVCGVVNLRGRLIPVLSLRGRLGLPAAEVTKDSRIVIVESAGRLLGLIVDRVGQVMRLAAALLEPPPEEAGIAREFVSALGRAPETVLVILDLDRALSREFDPEMKLNETEEVTC